MSASIVSALADFSAPVSTPRAFCPAASHFKNDEQRDAAQATAQRYQMLLGFAGINLERSRRLIELATQHLGWLSKRYSASVQVAAVVTEKFVKAHAADLADIPSNFNAAVAGRVLQLASAQLGRKVPGDNVGTQLARILDRQFWLKHFSKLARQRDEFAAIKSGSVSAKGQLYVSDLTLARHAEALAAQQAWLESSVLIDKHAASRGQFKHIKLAAAAKRAEHRDASLWAFLTGIEQLSVEAELQCALVTLTAPSRFHANPGNGGKHFDGVSTPQDSHRYIASRWNSFQRDLANVGFAVSGIRATEPQADGTCHWHVWLHYASAALPTILARLAHYFPGDLSRKVEPIVYRTVESDLSGDKRNKSTGERFAERFSVLRGADLVGRGRKPVGQVDFSVINRAYASGATYMAKYTVKSFDKSDNFKRVHAWRWTWGIRGFQVFGLRNCRSLWDELYRAVERPLDTQAAQLWDAVHNTPGRHTRPIINPVTGARETQEYEGGTAAFIRLQGGLAAAGRGLGLRIRIDYVDATGRYGDVLKRRLGLAIYEGDNELYRAVTREPGRWVMCGEDRVSATFKALRSMSAESTHAFSVDLETGEILTLH